MSSSAGFHAAIRDYGGEVFNVKHVLFGAVGDGITNDTVAIQAAITAAWAVGGTVFFPAGIYLCGAITLPTPTAAGDSFVLRLCGPSPGVDIQEGYTAAKHNRGAIIKSNAGSSDLFAAVSTNGGQPTYEFENLAILGPDTVSPRTTTSGNAIRVSGTASPRVFFRGVTIAQFFGAGKAGVWLDNVLFWSMRDVNINECDIGLKLTTFSNAFHIANVKLQGCASYGGYWEDIYSAAVDALTVQTNEKTGLYLKGVHNVHWSGCHFENNNTSAAVGTYYALSIESVTNKSCQRMTFTDCVFNGTKDRVLLTGQDSSWGVVDIKFINCYNAGVSAPALTLNDYCFDIVSDASFPLSAISAGVPAQRTLTVITTGMYQTPLRARRADGDPNTMMQHKEVTALSASDVTVATGFAIGGIVRNVTQGQSAMFLYDGSFGVDIVAQGDAAFVTGAPGAAEMQLKHDGGTLKVRAGSGRNNDVLHFLLLGAHYTTPVA